MELHSTQNCVSQQLVPSYTTTVPPPHAMMYYLKGSPSQRRRTGGDNDSSGRHGFKKSGDGQEEEGKEEDEERGDRLLLVASPPLGQKRLSGARPLVGKSPPRGCVKREGLQEQEGKGSGSRFVPQAWSCSGKGTWGDEGGSNRSTPHFRSAAAEDEKEQMDTDDAILPSGCDGEHGVTQGARGNDRVRRLGSKEESVRKVAESFVGNVFDDLSSTASLSRRK